MHTKKTKYLTQQWNNRNIPPTKLHSRVGSLIFTYEVVCMYEDDEYYMIF
jgi:hypothetical protein